MSVVEFAINGINFAIQPNTLPFETSLGNFIREHAHLTGTKFMCREGGCGCCIVMVKGTHPASKTDDVRSVNSCLLPIFSCHGLEITTIEALGNRKDGYGAIQKRLVHFNGTQCGYCSPGFVMSMHSLLKRNKEQVTTEDVETVFGGNTCRCTGYRPILDAMKSFSADADEKLKQICEDIEDLRICPKTGLGCGGTCKKPQNSDEEHIHLKLDGQREWHKVYNIADIFAIFRQIKNRPYMLVGGNTATGVHRRDPNIEVFIDITSVEELRSYTTDNNSVVFGGNVTLTEAISIFANVAGKLPDFEYLRKLSEHIKLIAHTSVRNTGTLAGNLSIKHKYNDFESDIFVLLESVNAQLTITDYKVNSVNVSPLEFLRLDMNKKVIVKITFPPYPAGTYIYQSYTIKPISQNAVSDVIAGFLLCIDSGKRICAGTRIVYGGISGEFVHANATEMQLSSGAYRLEDLFVTKNLQDILQLLMSEILPNEVQPKASPEYRRSVAVALFYKFVLSICPPEKIIALYRTGATLLERGISSGRQVYDTNRRNWPLTQPVTKLEAIFQTAGEAIYINDIPHLPNQLWAAFVLATKIGYSVAEIDPKPALAMDGVHSFYSAKDIPGVNSFTPLNIPLMVENEEIFCSGKVLFNGQPVGIIIANSFEIAHSAAEFVEITYEKINDDYFDDAILTSVPAVLDMIDLEKLESRVFENAQGSFQSPDYDPKAVPLQGMKNIKGRNLFPGQYHYHMETQLCICVPNDNNFDLFCGTQWIDMTQNAIAGMLDIRQNRINIRVSRIGGAFGAKVSRATQIACATALACHLTNRPIRFVMSLETNMKAIGKRWGCLSEYEVDVNDKGHIEKLTTNYYQDYGCALNETVQIFTAPAFRNCYDNKGWNVKSYSVKTDAPKATFFRAPGTNEGIAMIENIIENIALDLNLEPADVRLANFASEFPIKKIYNDFIKSVDYRDRKKKIDEWNSMNRWRKRGIATSVMRFPIVYFYHYAALVVIYQGDGTVAITHGGIDIGQGVNTKAAQVAAYTLNIPLDYISVKASTNITGANAFATGGSTTSDAVCFAVRRSCQTLLERLKPVRDANPGKSWQDITRAAYQQSVDLSASYQFKSTDNPAYDVWGVGCAETEVDLLTGKHQLVRVDVLEDVGASMSPLIDVGQVEGAFMQGMGYWLQEKLVFDRQTGELLTNRSWNYKPPGARDIPIDFRVKFLSNGSTTEGVLSSKGTGECALCLGVVCAFALRHALNSARCDVGLKKEYFDIEYPLSPERVFLLSAVSSELYKID